MINKIKQIVLSSPTQIEFKDKYGLFKLPKSIDIEETKLLGDFELKVNRILNH